MHCTVLMLVEPRYSVEVAAKRWAVVEDGTFLLQSQRVYIWAVLRKGCCSLIHKLEV